TTVSGLPGFQHLYGRLRAMAFYNLVPAAMREPVPVDGGMQLARDGRNIGSAIEGLKRKTPDTLKRVIAYLAKIVPDVTDVERLLVGSRETVEFKQGAWTFEALQMSDGTLRALGVLTAALQGGMAPLVGIEEPEIALHPAAFGVLRDALAEGSESAQLLITSQSPELLNDPDIKLDQILAAEYVKGETRLGAIAKASADMLRTKLFTVGELVRQDQIEVAAP
ncbi:MAG: AAA family ATPase, partial [Terracidiphilus sp.]